eukprot:gene43748-64121_t
MGDVPPPIGGGFGNGMGGMSDMPPPGDWWAAGAPDWGG